MPTPMASVDGDRSTVDGGRSSVDVGRSTVDGGRSNVDAGGGMIDGGCEVAAQSQAESFLVRCTDESCDCYRGGQVVSACVRGNTTCVATESAGTIHAACCTFVLADAPDAGLDAALEPDAGAEAEDESCSSNVQTDQVNVQINCDARGNCSCFSNGVEVRRCSSRPPDCRINVVNDFAYAGCCGQF